MLPRTYVHFHTQNEKLQLLYDTAVRKCLNNLNTFAGDQVRSITFWSINTTTFFLWTKMFSPINTEDTTIVPVVYLYDTVFGGKGVVERDAGAGAAVGVVLTLIIIAVYAITNVLLKDSDLEY